MARLPAHLYNDEEYTKDLLRAIGIELEKLRQAREDLFLQLRPSTSTWGMARYEREYAVTTDTSKGMEQRLARWRAKRRGTGTSTVERIRSVAGSFTDGEVEVTERPREYRFIITATTEQQAPPIVSDMYSAIDEIKPAHLGVGFVSVQKSRGVIYLGAGLGLGQTLTVHPWQPEPIDSRGAVYIGAGMSTAQELSIQPKEA